MQSNNQNILVFDTTTVACTVALSSAQQVFSKHVEIANIHSQELLTMIDDLLREADIKLDDLNFLAVGVGPGSFTGLRIGIGVAQALAYCHDLKIIPISSLEMLAVTALSHQNNTQQGAIFVAHDARMSEVYTANFAINNDARLSLIDEVFLRRPEQVEILQIDNEVTDDTVQMACGNAWHIYQEKMPTLPVTYLRLEESLTPNAKHVADYVQRNLSQFDQSEWQVLSPIYVRNDVAKKSTKKLF